MTETPVEKPLRVVLSITLSLTLFAVMNMLVKVASEDLPVPQVLFFRCALGMIPVAFMIFHSGNLDLFRTQRHSGHFVRSFIGFFSMCCFFWSFALLPLANATAIHFAAPLILTALSVLLLDEKVGVHRWSAVIVGLGAVLFMLQPAGAGNPLGSLVAINAALLSAFAMVAVRKLGSTEHSLTIVFYFTLYSTVFSGIWAAFVWETPDLRNAFYLVLIGLLGGIGQIFLTHAYARAPAAFVSSFSYLAIVMAAFLDFIVWHRVPGWQIWVGSAVVIASGLYIVWREARKHYATTTSPNPDAIASAMPTKMDTAEKDSQG
ncbi:MAG: DMT family transporter [Micavibrio aeruginosavorus]|nr:DMT family transporter [Micavibrio aeruginosavorus]